MDYELLAWPPNGPKLRLDHTRFSYAGKFVMTNTGKAVAREGDTTVGAIAFNEDRTDENTLWLRYITVARDRRGEGIGPELVTLVRDRAKERGYDRLRIAVNNPFAYEALYRAGFGYTGETTGIAELVLEYPPTATIESETATDEPVASEDAGRTRDAYQAGLDEFRNRDLSDAEHSFLDSRRGSEPPPPEATGRD
ncbi:GNAT family N-acetyltransferase [Natrialba asiatica]|uniref:N-acetyltransferase GCN5 n=1 Tax=Natrialba asiatica (strain ATCC 700177 / DSM 12278 / JCM 9576 / FERM P-10747 / NBRC 102637 / 172P1) TaxID=29540 RepID=M0ANW7_NATA1|nr:GNAT family N-acetyltransferase [Natrialba asiatica]ELZ00426.1 N-acetyltransferase GCN5 [Natrialba asiatica DSM 12278]